MNRAIHDSDPWGEDLLTLTVGWFPCVLRIMGWEPFNHGKGIQMFWLTKGWLIPKEGVAKLNS